MTKSFRTIEALRALARLAIVVVAVLTQSPAQAQSAATPPRNAGQIEQLVAPVALYPDSLLSQVLMASTYPLEVVEAARWSRENSDVTGQALDDAMQKQAWDASVKALTSVPQTLQMMNDKLDWTQQLGDAFLAQQKDVLDAVQRLRARADAAGYLKEGEQQKVTRTPAPAQPRPAAPGQPAAPSLVYTIESANPEIYYVPIYDPAVVYGTWPYPDYAPFYWYPSGHVASNVFSFAAGVVVGAAVWSHVDWRRNNIDIDVNRYNRFNRTNITNSTWTHDPAHRRGVAYRDSSVAQRFGDQGKAAAREEFRGKADAGRRDLAKQGEAGKRDLAKQGAGGKRDQAKQGTTGKGDAAKSAGKSKTAAKTKTAGQTKTAAKTKSAGQTKTAAKSKSAGQPKQAAKSKQAARPKQAGGSQAARQTRASRPQPAPRAQAQHSMRPAGGGGGRGGGGRRR